MKLQDRIQNAWKAFKRQSTAIVQPWYNFFSPVSTDVEINEATVTGVAAFWAGVQLKANSFSTPRINILKEENGNLINQRDHRIYKLLNQRPNSMMTAFSFRSALSYNRDVHGNGFAVIVRDDNFNPIELIPVLPPLVEVRRVSNGILGEIVYIVNPHDGGETIVVGQDNMFHWLGLSNDGLVGISVLQRLAQVFGIAISGDRQQKTTFEKGSNISGLLSIESKLQKGDIERIRKAWNENYNGAEAKFGTAVLDNGAKFQPVALSPVDAQLLESRQFSANQMAQILNLPPTMIGILDRATDNNMEQQGIQFVRLSLNPEATKFEQEVWRKLLSERDKENHIVEFDFSDLERGDSEAVSSRLESRYKMGTMTRDEIRMFDKMNPLPDGKGESTYIQFNTTEDDINTQFYLTKIELDQAKTEEIKAKTEQLNNNGQ